MPIAPLVLVVEDDEGIRTALCDLIYDEGYNARGVKNGREALEYLKSAEPRPCLILLDLLMPEVTGWEVLSRMNESERMSTIPVCAMSGAAVIGPEGNVRFIRKPLNLDKVLAVVREYCEVSH